MHRWNIFLIEALSMFASPQIKMVKPPDKKRGISDRSSFCVGVALNSQQKIRGTSQELFSPTQSTFISDLIQSIS